MLTACRDELPNPHRNCIHELLNSLACHDNDYQCINIGLRSLHQEFQREINNAIFQCSEKRKLACASEERLNEFQKNVENIDNTTECYNRQIEDMQNKRQSVVAKAKQCFVEFQAEKCKFKKFHEKTIDHLKTFAVQSNDPVIVRNCEKDINEINKQFVKEVAYIRKCESVLGPFLKVLHDCTNQLLCKCCFKEYEWMPQGKSMKMLDSTVNEIKSTMGSTLKKAFAQLHIHQPTDVKSFLASYLMNLERNEEILREKLNTFEMR